MSTIGEVYNPLISAALNNDPKGAELLRAVGEQILINNPERCPDLADGIRAAKLNLDYYCQYFSDVEAAKVKKFYGLGQGFIDLSGKKHDFS